MDAILLNDVSKRFHRYTERRYISTMKTELVNLLRGKRKKGPAAGEFVDAIRGITLAVPKGKTVGLIGRNGSGKSTLLKLITGIYRPTSGTIQVNGRISALLDLGAGFHPDFTGRENILINGIILGMSRAEVRDRMDEIIAFSELGEFIDAPVRTYSSGMYMRLAFSVATHVDPEILIVDEILAVGDEHFGRKSLAKMMDFKQRGKTILLVTHDLETLQRWCDHGAWIDGGSLRMFGHPREVVEAYRRAVAQAESDTATHATPALTPGVPLPATLGAAARPPSGPQVSPEQRWGSYEVCIDEVACLDPAGNRAGVVHADGPLEVVLDFRCYREVDDVGFVVSFVRADGLIVYESSTAADHLALPRPLPSSGRVRLRIDRLGLVPGDYRVDVAARSSTGHVYDQHRNLHALGVHASFTDGGLVRPPHAWVVTDRAAEVAPTGTTR